MRKVRAKFSCQSVEKFTTGSKVKLGAVYSSSGENADFADATPSGGIEMYVNAGRPAEAAFAPGEEYYVDFTPVRAQEPAAT